MRNTVATFFVMLVASTALAQFNRTAVSVTGDDLNACTTTSPCRSFGRALAQTNSGGEILALDSGGYGPVTIDRSVTLQAVPGAYAGISASGVDGIVVSAMLGDRVTIRGVTINSLGPTSAAGIRFNNAAVLSVENTTVTGFNYGVLNASFASSRLYVLDLLGRHNLYGIAIVPATGPVRTEIDRSRLLDNGNVGIDVNNDSITTVTNTIVAGGQFSGFRATNAGANGGVQLNLSFCTATDFSDAGVAVFSANAVARVSNCTLVNNGTGLRQTAGTLETLGNNFVRGNTAPSSGAITTVPTM